MGLATAHKAAPVRRDGRTVRLLREALVWLPALLLVVWTATPILWAFTASLKQPLEIYESTSLLPRSPSLDAYRQVVQMRGFPRWFLNSVVITAVATVVPLVLSVVAAYAFARYAFRLRHVLLLLFLIPRILPRVALIVPLYDLLFELGLLNTYAGLFLTYIASAVPLATWLLVGFIAGVPRELEESAAIDGASLWIRLRYVVIPMIWPGIVTAAVLCVREAWNEFPFVLAFTNTTEMRTLPYQLYVLEDAMGIQDWAVYNAFTIMTILPLLVLYLLLERRIVSNIVGGALK